MLSARALAATIVVALAPRLAAAAPTDRLASTDWDGASELVRIASDVAGPESVHATDRLDYSTLTPRDAVVLVHPDAALDVESLASFMRDGGRVLLLDETEHGDALLDHFGVHRAPPPREPAHMLRHNPALALALAASEPPHASADGVGRVVTNHPTVLLHPDLTPVLSIPTEGGDAPLLAVAGAVGQGRLLAVGDGSIVLNAMLRYPGNRAFARGMIRYARDDDTWGPRHGRVFIVVGRVEQTGSYGEPAEGDGVRALLRAARAKAATLAAEGLSRDAALALAAVVGACVLIWTMLRAARLHARTTPGYARAVPVSAQGGVAGHEALLVAPGTSRILGLIELKRALEEELCWLCGFDTNRGAEAILRAVAERGWLGRTALIELRALFVRLANAETVLLARRASSLPRTSDAEVVAVAKAMGRVLREVRANAARVQGDGAAS